MRRRGQAIGAPTAILIRRVGESGGATSIRSSPFEYKVERAPVIVTRPIFRRARFAVHEALESAGLPVVAGVFPFEERAKREFMANEVRACASRTRCSSACARDATSGRRTRGSPSRARLRQNSAARSRASGIDPVGDIESPWQSRWTSLNGPE